MTRRTPLLLLSCAILATVLYLWPFRLVLSPVFHTNDAAWTGPAPGVTFAQNGVLRTERPPQALFERLVGGDGLTLAVRLTSGTRDQAGPARIVTYSDGAARRNFTLAQNHADLVFRLRTSADDPNGLADQITVHGVFTPGRVQHIVVTAPAELTRPAAYLHGTFAELLTRHGRSPQDFAFNFALFALMGILLAAWGGSRRNVDGRSALLAVVLVVGAVTGLEALQFYVDGRTPSARDLAAAVAGGLTGFLLRSTSRATEPEG